MNENKVTVSEHVLELRHHATGRLLDVRGSVADYIKSADIFPHWEIDTNVVKFRDAPKKCEKVGAFAGYQSAGVFVYDPDTRNYFEDKSRKFWKALIKNQHYDVPDITRFGCRSKLFYNSSKSFEELNSEMYNKFFSEDFRSLVGKKERDLQIVIELKEDDFDIRITIGPIHKDEASRYFAFQSDHFTDAGVYLDIDVYKSADVAARDVPSLTKKAMEVSWSQADSIAAKVGA